MYIDLDGFKLINDTLGHEVGDELLKEAAKRLLLCVRHGDTVARLGGDEFTIIMPNLGEIRHAPVIAQRMIEALEQPFLLERHEAYISASIGIPVFPDDAPTPIRF
jgi:diguanylate cyclase (GGDEF)-like protein